MPPSIQQSNAKHYKSDQTLTEVKEFEGPHLLPAWPGWEEVADYALDWAVEHARQRERRVSERPPHPHRRADDADRGGWLADPDRPDVRRPRPEVLLRLGDGVAQARPGRRSRPPRSARSTRCCSATTTTTTTSTPPGARCCRRRASWSPRRRARSGSAASARGLEPWHTTVLEAPGRPAIEITATPCRHGPPGCHPIVGDVIGFALRWEGQQHGALWITGDTVLYDGVREVAGRRAGGHRAAAPRRRAASRSRARCATR